MSFIELPCPLVLASASRYKKAQLERFGLPFEAIEAPIEEEMILADAPHQTVALRAAFKACSLQEQPQFSESWVLGADQGVVLHHEGAPAELLGKPGSPEAAVDQLMRLAGRSHELFTAVALALPGGRLLEASATVKMWMRPFSIAEAQAVVEADETWDCAGAYKIERAGPWLMDRIEAEDPTSIEGLPMIVVGRLLRSAWSGQTS